jgi:hypothetical protein
LFAQLRLIHPILSPHIYPVSSVSVTVTFADTAVVYLPELTGAPPVTNLPNLYPRLLGSIVPVRANAVVAPMISTNTRINKKESLCNFITVFKIQ